MNGEVELIDRIRKAIPSGGPFLRSGHLRVGIGDDAAVMRQSCGVETIITCDSFLENVHFLIRAHPADSVGFKALARATSDLAAMGAVPRVFLLSLALPTEHCRQWLDDFLAGMARAARTFRLVLAGGDVAQHPSVAISVTVVGAAERGRAVTRSGARPGDLLYVSGRPGSAQLGLELVLRGLYGERHWKPLLRPHLYPRPRLELGQWLARRRAAARRLASAMIDTSDGLSTDLQRLCESSGLGARLWADQIPVVDVPQKLVTRGIEPLELALHGGEDYELLFSVPRRLSRLVPKACCGAPITQIGEMTRAPGMVLVGSDGRAMKLLARGWDHFRALG